MKTKNRIAAQTETIVG